MKCAVHSDVDAVGFCRNCGKAMCSTCVRPVRDVLYCEDCLATVIGIPGVVPAGVSSAAASSPGVLPPPLPARSQSSPSVAFLLGLCPGLGAVYNGEYNKALIHVVVFVTLVVGASSDVDTALMVILILSSIGFCFFMAFDAMRVAKAKNLGGVAPDPLESLTKNRPVGPILLIALGVLFLLNNFDWFSFHRVERFLWPLILIGVGVMMFRNRLGNRA